MNTNKKWIAAACASAALLMSGALQAADSHTITVNATVAGNCKFNAGTSTLAMTLDPTASATVSQSASVLYRCTKGTSPVFVLSSGSTSSATGGNLVNGSESIPYTYTSTTGGAGTGMTTGGSNDKTLSVNVSVNQANAANVTPNTYTDTIAITLTP